LDLSTSDARTLGGLIARVHLELATVMPAAGRPTVAVTDARTATDRIDRYLTVIAQRTTRDAFDRFAEAELHRRRRLLDRVAALRPAEDVAVGPCGWTHGDFQHLNLLWRAGEVSAVLDWDRLDVRPLGLEVARSATLLFGSGDARGLDLDRVTAFVAGYRTTNPDLTDTDLTDTDLADAVHRLWWERVSNDLWHLRLHYDEGSDSCDHYFHSASALLTWWTDHRADVAVAFTAGSTAEPLRR
jgi:homoserine kinase type II